MIPSLTDPIMDQEYRKAERLGIPIKLQPYHALARRLNKMDDMFEPRILQYQDDPCEHPEFKEFFEHILHVKRQLEYFLTTSQPHTCQKIRWILKSNVLPLYRQYKAHLEIMEDELEHSPADIEEVFSCLTGDKEEGVAFS